MRRINRQRGLWADILVLELIFRQYGWASSQSGIAVPTDRSPSRQKEPFLLGSKAGLKIISARNDAGERTYRIAK